MSGYFISGYFISARLTTHCHAFPSFESPETVILPSVEASSSLSSSSSSSSSSLWPSPMDSDVHCHFHACVNVYRCGRNDHHKIKVYIYPLVDYLSQNDGGVPVTPTPMSKDYHEMLTAIYYSEYYTNNPGL